MKIKKKLFLKYVEKIYLIRLTEQEISKRYSEKKMRCPVHLSIGQEAPSAALNLILTKSDFAISYHRAHAHYLAKNGSLKKMISELYGKKTGCSAGYGGSMHLIDKKKKFIGSTAIVSSSIPVGAGFAHTFKKNSKSRVCIYLGDASCEEGVFFETLNFVVLKKLPVIFFCENNKFSVFSNMAVRQPQNRKLYKLASAFGIKSHKLSAANPIEFYLKLNKIIKNNSKPIFIEVDTYRYFEHCGPNEDDHLNYRPKNEVNYWKTKDPVLLMERYAVKNNIASLDKLKKMKSKIIRNINDAFMYAEKSPPPNYNDFLKLSN